MTKHEPTETKQIQYPGGKDGMWNSKCSAGDYVSPPEDTAERAEANVKQHGAAKAAKAENRQVLQEENGTVEIDTEITGGRFEMCLDKTDKFGDTAVVTAVMDYDQLWEHVHNCLDALERMGRDQKPKVQL